MVPRLVFIVPYRNRPQQQRFFTNYIKIIMHDRNDYEFYFSTQTDQRPFNRGATKNIGFLAIKNKYPNDYKNITFVFNDVDTLPYDKDVLTYDTIPGTIKHFYGYTNALGGIVSIKGIDFERINGFPNYWAWGKEDNVLQDRALSKRLIIDRSCFFPIGHPSILQLFDGLTRVIDKQGIKTAREDNGTNGISSIRGIKCNIKDNDIIIDAFDTQTSHTTIGYEKFNIAPPPPKPRIPSMLNSYMRTRK